MWFRFSAQPLSEPQIEDGLDFLSVHVLLPTVCFPPFYVDLDFTNTSRFQVQTLEYTIWEHLARRVLLGQNLKSWISIQIKATHSLSTQAQEIMRRSVIILGKRMSGFW